MEGWLVEFTSDLDLVLHKEGICCYVGGRRKKDEKKKKREREGKRLRRVKERELSEEGFTLIPWDLSRSAVSFMIT